jgi:PKD repeat protein
MKKNILRNISFLCLLFTNSQVHSQAWITMMQDPTVNFYSTVDTFNAYWLNKPMEKGKGYKTFRRWEAFLRPRVFPSGEITNASLGYENFEAFKTANPGLFLEKIANAWTPMGPVGAPAGGGAGRLNFVRQDPTNASIIYVGAPDGGIWKTINGGTSWTTLTDQVTATCIGFGDLAIDPTNNQILYATTGDSEASDTYSVGVLKSTDGGTTWLATGLVWTVNQYRNIRRILIDPSNTQKLIISSSNGIYRTINGGTSWTQTKTGDYWDMEFQPTIPNTVYATGKAAGSSDQFFKSTDNGVTFTQIVSVIPTTGVQRISIAVTPANNAYVYLLAGRSSDQGLMGVYQSTTSGASFTSQSTSPNYLGYNSNGSDAGGQAFYDLSIGCSQTNASEVFIGGVNIWRSINGGTSFAINAHWTGSGAPYVHADIHDIVFSTGSGTTLFAACDGGIFKSTNNGTAWSDISANLSIAQQYSISSAVLSATKVLSGHQDNGTNFYNAGVWSQVYGGDGMDVIIDRTNNATFYEGYVSGDFRRSTNSGGAWTNIFTSQSGTGNWHTPIKQDPITANTIYAGYDQLYKSTNQGTASAAISAFSGANNITEFAVAPSNASVIYVIRGATLQKTTNGGTNWTDITGTLPVALASMTYVAISNVDPLKVWVTFSGYNAANKVFKSINGGTTWTNISTGLPNLPVNCIVFQNSTVNDGIYIGTDVGVYYKDNLLAGWQTFFSGLPNVAVRELDIYYTTGKLRAATYGRGTWQSDVNSATNPPVAAFLASNLNGCVGTPIQFTDQSGFSPTSWAWTFPSGTPATSTVQNPTCTWNTPGTYSVTLIATNANGSNSISQSVTISAATTITSGTPLVEGFVGATFPPANWSITNVGDPGTWVRNAISGFAPTTGNSALFDNFTVDNRGSRDLLNLPNVNVAGATTVTITFDVAHAPYGTANIDTLIVQVSADCGSTWTNVYSKNGTTLATNGGAFVTAFYTPAVAAWRTEVVNLNAYNSSSSLLVRFVNGAGYGNSIYIDNVNLSITGGGIPPVASMTSSATTVCTGQTVNFTNTSTGATSYAWSFPSGTPLTAATANASASWAVAGTYTVQMTATNGFGSTIATQVITVNTTPATPTISAGGSTTFCAGGSVVLTSSSATGNVWSTGATTQSITVSTAGTYTVTRTTGGCTSLPSAGTTVTVNPLPATPTISAGGSTTFCAGGSVVLTSSSATGNVWSTGATTQSITVSTAGTYTVTRTTGGCTSLPSAGTTVTVNPTPATPVATVTTPICSGTTINLSTALVGGATYAWTGPNSFTSTSQNPSIISSTAAMAGVYSVVVTNTGCASLGGNSSSLVVNPTPATPVATNTGAYCTGNTIALSTPIVAGAIYAWTGPLAFSSALRTPTRTGATVGMAGVYTVTVTVGGCTSIGGTTTVSVNSTTVAPAITTNTPVCTGNNITLSTPTVAGATYAWSGPNAYSNTTQNPTILSSTALMAGSYSLTITVAGCTSAIGSSLVVVNTTPVAPSPTVTTPICSGSTINLTTPLNAGDTYLWTGPNSFSSTAQNPAIAGSTGAMSGIYTLNVTNNGCVSAAGNTASLVVNTTPVATISPSVATICIGQSSTLTGSGTGSYLWSTTAATPAITVNPLTSTTYTLTVDNGFCSAIASQLINVNLLPVINAGVDQTICPGSAVTLSGIGGLTYLWNNGVTNGTPFTPLTPLTYTVTGTDINGCSNTDAMSISFFTAPILNLGADILQVNPGSILDAGTGWSSIVWNTTATSQTIVADTNGTYYCNVTDANGCATSDTISVMYTASINQLTTDGMSIALYPNPSDGFFKIELTNLNTKKLDLFIFDAIGKVVYANKNIEVNNSVILPVDLRNYSDGTYTIRLMYNNKSEELKIIKTK